MERLTKKIKVRGRETYRISPSLQHRGEVKLGQLEDIEEELGIDLVTLFKTKEVYTKIYGLLNEIIVMKKSIWVINIEDKELLIGSPCSSYSREISDYGKTWALTKEELE